MMMRLPVSSCVALSRRIGRHGRPPVRGRILRRRKKLRNGRVSRPPLASRSSFERRAAVALTQIRQEARRRVNEDQARESRREEIRGQKCRRERTAVAGLHACPFSSRCASAASKAVAPTLPPETPLMAKR